MSVPTSTEFRRHLGHLIRKARIEKDMTQQVLADRLKVTRGAVAAMEAGRQGVDCYRLVQMAEILEVHVGYFLGRPTPKFDPNQDVLRGVLESDVMSGKITQSVADWILKLRDDLPKEG